MKILFITRQFPDYLQDTLLRGLRRLYGSDCIDCPRKGVLYGELPVFYSNGFTLWTTPMQDIKRSTCPYEDIDIVILGAYRRQTHLPWPALLSKASTAPKVAYIDGEDATDVPSLPRPYFKRELTEALPGVYATGFGVPEDKIRPIDLEQKRQIYQSHVVDPEIADDTGYKFNDEKDYYDDMARSFFGITTKKAGWDCMRHYEILAAGALLAFRDYGHKPLTCPPRCDAILSYSSREDFMRQAKALVPDGKPTPEYRGRLDAQRKWLLLHGTCKARAEKLVADVEAYYAETPIPEKDDSCGSFMQRQRFNRLAARDRLLYRLTVGLESNRFTEWLYRRMKRRFDVYRFVRRLVIE